MASALAREAGGSARWQGTGSARFAYFCDDRRFVIVAGAQEREHVDLALAYGLTYRGQLPLVLVLPHDMAFPTVQRAAWLVRHARPRVLLHDGESVESTDIPSHRAAVENVIGALDGLTPAEELAKASTPKHLGPRSDDVADLVEWAARHPHLDPGHRRSQRSWHCLGQRVLSIETTHGGVRIRAGIHASDASASAPSVVVPAGTPATAAQLDAIQREVEAGVAARLRGAYNKPDEHWLQAVVRRTPSLTGIEQPALRELPAWRPVIGSKRWGRGFIDLLGLDAHGDIRLVETKLAQNSDELLILQGIDYYTWALAYDDVLRRRLGAAKRSQIIVHYVIGANTAGKVTASPFALAQADALGIPWRFQTVSGWFHPPQPNTTATAELLPRGQLPNATN